MRITDLLQHYEENTIQLPPVENTSVQRIKALVHKELPLRRRGRSTLLIAAIVCLLVSVSAVAAVWRAGQFQETESVVITMGTDEQDAFEIDRNATITYKPQNEPTKPNIMGFTLSWLPKNATEYMDSVTLQSKLFDGSSVDPQVLKEAKTNVQYVIGDPQGGQVINVDIYSSGDVTGKMFVPWGEITLEKEGMLAGMETLWISMTMKNTETKMLLLYHNDYNCVVTVGSFKSGQSVSFKELERIAKGLTLVDSGVPSVDTNPDWNWKLLAVGLG